MKTKKNRRDFLVIMGTGFLMATGVMGAARMGFRPSSKKGLPVSFVSEIKFPQESFETFKGRRSEWCHVAGLKRLEDEVLKPLNAKWSYREESHSVTITRQFKSYEDYLVWKRAVRDSDIIFKRPESLGYIVTQRLIRA